MIRPKLERPSDEEGGHNRQKSLLEIWVPVKLASDDHLHHGVLVHEDHSLVHQDAFSHLYLKLKQTSGSAAQRVYL